MFVAAANTADSTRKSRHTGHLAGVFSLVRTASGYVGPPIAVLKKLSIWLKTALPETVAQALVAWVILKL